MNRKGEINRQAQKSYNWTYGGIVTGARMLPVLSRAIVVGASKPQGDLSKLVRNYAGRLTSVTEELRTLSEFLKAPVLGTAADAIAQVCAKLADAERELARPDRPAASRAVDSAVSQLERVKLLLDQQSPIKFRLWLLNPWRNYPRRIGATLPSRAKKPKSRES